MDNPVAGWTLALARGGVGPFSRTCAAPVENAPQCLPGGTNLSGLPGARRVECRVLPMPAMCRGYITAEDTESTEREGVKFLDAA